MNINTVRSGVRAARKKRYGLPVLARKSGVSLATLYRILHGYRPREQTLKKIARRL